MKTHQQIAEDVVSAIERDIEDRRGLKQEWDSISEAVKEEIRMAWRFEVHKGLNACIGYLNVSRTHEA